MGNVVSLINHKADQKALEQQQRIQRSKILQRQQQLKWDIEALHKELDVYLETAKSSADERLRFIANGMAKETQQKIQVLEKHLA